MNLSKLAVVFLYEFRKMTMNKVFLLTTLFGPVLLVGITVLPSILAMKSLDRTDSVLHVGMLPADSAAREGAETLLVPLVQSRGWEVRVSEDEAALRSGVLDGSLDGYLTVPAGFPSGSGIPAWFTKSSTDMFVFEAMKNIVSSVAISERARLAGVDETWVRSLLAPVEVPVYRVDEDGGERETDEGDFVMALMTGLVFCMLIYMTVLLYGQQTGRSVVAEKSSKIVDILLSSARAEDILFGKILGIGLAGLAQYAVWMVMTGAALKLAGPLLHFDLPVSLGIDRFAWLTLFFTLGYFLYASFYASFGAASEDDQHMAQLSMPVVFILMIPMLMMQVFIQRPDSTLAVVFSYVPFTSPMVMMLRVLSGSAGAIEAALSALILVASIIVSGIFAAKIFRTGLLMTGKNFTLRDIFAWLRA